ncbi:MAG: flagellar hook-basal body complex protein FliE [Verrucomicrobiota bacterium]
MDALSAIQFAPGAQLPAVQRMEAPISDAELAALPSAQLRPASDLRPLTAPPADGSFGRVLGEFVQEVNGKQAAAGEAVNGLLSGQGVSLHQAMIAMEEASVSFQLMVEVRNKLLESYQELMRMQI